MTEEELRAQQQMAQEAGYERYGQKSFDDSAHTLHDKLGNRAVEFLAVVAPFDKAPDIIAHLGNNPDRLEQISKLSTPRMVAEVARVEAELSPNGRANPTGSVPAYKHESSRGHRVPDDVWRAGADNLTNDQWNREFDRRDRERAGEPHVSTEAQRWAERVRRG
jgi:hypothetical protein